MPSRTANHAVAFDAGNRLKSDRHSYRSQPTVVVYEDGKIERADIVNNTRRHLSTPGRLRFDPAAAVETGVWESFAERAPLRSTDPVEHTSTAFRELQRQGAAIHIITPQDADQLASLGHSATTQHDIEKVLDSGDLVIVAEASSPDQASTFWWRINSRSGETLGMSTGGYGSVYTEQVVALRVVSMAIATHNFVNCVRSGPSGGAMCCFVVGVVMSAHGNLIGLLSHATVGASFGLAAGAVGASGRICR